MPATDSKTATKLSFARRLFETLLESDELHVPSTQTSKYRNKITYSIPLPDPLSPLAQDHVNEACRIVAQYPKAPLLFREVMVKATRNKRILIRITVLKSTNDNIEWKDDFVHYMCRHLPDNLECLCYNETFTKARPTKNHPIHVLYGAPFVLETTPNDLVYQISPDTFCEVNHQVERLQYDQAESWLLQYCPCWLMRQDNENAPTLLVSGRDVSSFGLSFGSLVDTESGNKLFKDVLAVQHCPLVHNDAVANFERHCHVVSATVRHKAKRDMVHAIQTSHHHNAQNSKIVSVMTGGRKGLDPSYLKYLVENNNVKLIIYNSCSTKSLVRDMEGLLEAFHVQDFRSYNFFPGTKYTASLTLLIRQERKTLILPVGPAGVGKSSLATRLMEGGVANLQWWHRDAVFNKLRNEGNGLNKTKQLVHQDLLLFLRTAKGIIYVDSTNGSAEARQLYVSEVNADRVIYVSFEPRGNQKDVLEFLLERTRNRLGNNMDDHPSFPDTIDEQRKKHFNILKGIDYPTLETTNDGCTAKSLSVDPASSDDMELLPFSLFLELHTSDCIKQAVIKQMELQGNE